MRTFLNNFRATLDECRQIDDTTAQVLLLKGLKPNAYLLYSVLNDWNGGTLEDMYRKVWREYTGVVVARTPFGISPMELDAFRQRPRSPQHQRLPDRSDRQGCWRNGEQGKLPKAKWQFTQRLHSTLSRHRGICNSDHL